MDTVPGFITAAPTDVGAMEVITFMSKVRFIILSILTVLAVSATASATASAHEFLKNTEPITGTEPVLSEGGLFVLVAGARVVDCEKLTDSGTVLPAGVDFAKEIHFLNCKTAQAGCDVHSPGAPNGLILVSNVPTLLVSRENAAKEPVIADEFKSNPGTKEFVTLLFLALAGGSCSEYGTETKVKGQVAAQAVGELLVFPNPELKGNSLEAFGVAAKLFGDDTQMLTNGGKLSVN
jgi:hypothetical protein